MYLVIDKEQISEKPIVYGLFTTEEKANRAKERIAKICLEEIFNTDPSESGLDREYDESWVRAEIDETLVIIEIAELDKFIVPLPEGEDYNVW